MATDFKVPNLGEGISSGTVGRVLVNAGDSIAANQPLFELETDKAVTEINAPSAMNIVTVVAKEGQQVKVGEVLLTYEGGAATAPAPAAAVASAPAPAPAAAPTPTPTPAPAAPKLTVIEAPRPTPVAVAAPVAAVARVAGAPVVAAPSVRKLAREMGVDINTVPTVDPSGRVTAQDVINFAQGGAPAAAPVTAAAAPSPAPATPSAAAAAPSGTAGADRWGAVVREPMNGVRKKTVQHMTHCWTTIPHVTHFEKADISGLESLRAQYAKSFDAKGGKLTVTVFLIKVLALALRKFPKFNASIDTQTEEVLYKQYCNVGVAVDTPSGLLVPVIRDADTKSILDLSIEIPALAAKARDRKLSIDDMQGGCVTVTNLGGVGGGGFQSFTPIINSPEVAILGVSRAAHEPVFENGAFVPKLRLPLALSYDHRLIDGADAARFMKWYVQAIENPWTLFIDA